MSVSKASFVPGKRLIGACLAFLTTACAPEPKAFECSSEPPPTLADTGLFADVSRLEVASDNHLYVPQYPLWTDGATKRRWLHVPPGTSIDASDPDHWVFPIGTKLWKEFSFGRPVETRYLERRQDGTWCYATYLWNEAGTEARLAPERGVRRACSITEGVHHDLPGREDCKACHEGSAHVVLGVNALQLSPDRDPFAPHAETPPPGAHDLRDLVDAGVVRGLDDAFLKNPPRIAANGPRERAALGYLQANCSMCHNEHGPLAPLGLSFELTVENERNEPAAIRTTLGVESRFRFSSDEAAQRIVAGEPDRSVLPRRMGSRHAAEQMPPLGTHLVDQEALSLLREWIRVDLAAPRTARR